MTVMDLGSPQMVERTSIQNKSICSYSNYISLDTAGFLNNTTQYDGFQITQDSGGTIDATMTVYGYRKP